MARPAAEARGGRWAWAVPIVALAVALLCLLADPLPLQLLRNATFDQYQRWQPREFAASAPVRIVDIDDETLRRLGQWPWPRTRVAELIAGLQRRKAASIALDIVLAEPDRTSPRALLAGLGALPADAARHIASLPDHDELLAATLARSNAVIGFAPTNHPAAVADAPEAASPPVAKARFVTIGDSPLPFLPTFAASVRSLPGLQDAAAGQGAIVFVADTDGVVRKVPLVASVEGTLVPSLATEALRLAEHAGNITVRTAGQGGGLIDVGIGRHRIPTTADGAMWVHFTRPRAERYVPAWKVLAGEVPDDEFAGRIVLIGTSAQGLLDLRFSPLGGVIPGVEVHAQALEQVLADEALVRPGWAPATEWLVAALAGAAIGVVAMTTGAAVSVAAFLGLAAVLCIGAWQAFAGQRLLLDPVAATLVLGTVFLPTTVVRHVLSERRQRWVRQAFARYVSPNLVDHLIAHPEALALGGKRQRCSFVFADLAGFTTLMETMEAAAAVTVLNAYLDQMIRIAFEHEGTLDRIVGDAVAIVFSTPVEQIDHEERALRCALAMQRFARGFVDQWAARGVPFCETRIGVHSGEVTVGNFGGSTIFDYRALGDPVNTASRLEGANKSLGTLICVSEATLAGCPGAPARPIGRLKLAGRTQPVMAFEPLDPATGAASEDPPYAAAYAAMQAGHPDAGPAFERLAGQRPSDPLVQLHRRRLAAGARSDLIEIDTK